MLNHFRSSLRPAKNLIRMNAAFTEVAKPIVYPAADKNKEAILSVLIETLPKNCSNVLEIASGTGQHIVHFAKAFPEIKWQPSDIDQANIQSISAYITIQGVKNNVYPPAFFDVMEAKIKWPLEVAKNEGTYDAVLCSNLTHISPWACTLGLFSSAKELLMSESGLLLIYGPYAVNGVLQPESNVKFDQHLRSQNPEWGVRDISDMIKHSHGLQFVRSVDMPANNKMLVFKKQ